MTKSLKVALWHLAPELGPVDGNRARAISDGHIASCELAASVGLTSRSRVRARL
jgi:hypothetical protein